MNIYILFDVILATKRKNNEQGTHENSKEDAHVLKKIKSNLNENENTFEILPETNLRGKPDFKYDNPEKISSSSSENFVSSNFHLKNEEKSSKNHNIFHEAEDFKLEKFLSSDFLAFIDEVYYDFLKTEGHYISDGVELFDIILNSNRGSEKEKIMNETISSGDHNELNVVIVEEIHIEDIKDEKNILKPKYNILDHNYSIDILKIEEYLRKESTEYLNWFKNKLNPILRADMPCDVKFLSMILKLEDTFFVRIYYFLAYKSICTSNEMQSANKNNYFKEALMKDLKISLITNPFYQLKCLNRNSLAEMIKNFNESFHNSLKKISEIYNYPKYIYLINLFSHKNEYEKIYIITNSILFILAHCNNQPLFVLFPELNSVEKIIRKGNLNFFSLLNIHQILTIILLQYEYHKDIIEESLLNDFKNVHAISKYILSTRFLICTILFKYENNSSVVFSSFFVLFLNYMRCYNSYVFLNLRYNEFIYQRVFYFNIKTSFIHLSFINTRITHNNTDFMPYIFEMTEQAIDLKSNEKYFSECLTEYIKNIYPNKLKKYVKDDFIKIKIEDLLLIYDEIEREVNFNLKKLINSL